MCFALCNQVDLGISVAIIRICWEGFTTFYSTLGIDSVSRVRRQDYFFFFMQRLDKDSASVEVGYLIKKEEGSPSARKESNKLSRILNQPRR